MYSTYKHRVEWLGNPAERGRVIRHRKSSDVCDAGQRITLVDSSTHCAARSVSKCYPWGNDLQH